MKKKNPFNIKKEKKDEMINLIKHYFLNERQEELGDLAAVLLLDFITEHLAAEFYNQGVYDAYQFMNERNEDLLSILK